jgi:hypothetical protein
MNARCQTAVAIITMSIIGCGGTLKAGDDASDTSIATTDTATDETTDTTADVPEDGTPDVVEDTPGETGDVVEDPGDLCEAHPGENCVVLEHMGVDQTVTLEFSIDVSAADIYLLVDTTGTMDASITDVAAAFSTDIQPAASTAFATARFGLGHFNDFPRNPFGQTNDMPYWHMLDVTTDFASVQTELDTLPGNATWGNGNDLPESNTVALAITATGLGLDDVGGATIADQSCTDVEAFGYPCFGPTALPVVMLISDAPWHNGPGDSAPYDFTTYTYSDAVAEFAAAGIKFLGLHIPAGSGGANDGLPPMEDFATDTQSLDIDGLPLVSTGPASTAGERAAGLIDTLREQARFDVACDPQDVPDDPAGADIDATVFVQSVEPVSANPPSGFPDPTMDATTFYDATQGTELTFLVTLANTDHPSGSAPMTSLVWIVALGDGVTEIGREQIVVIVP